MHWPQPPGTNLVWSTLTVAETIQKIRKIRRKSQISLKSLSTRVNSLRVENLSRKNLLTPALMIRSELVITAKNQGTTRMPAQRRNRKSNPKGPEISISILRSQKTRMLQRVTLDPHMPSGHRSNIKNNSINHARLHRRQKILVDSGASVSLIKPKALEPDFKTNPLQQPIKIYGFSSVI